MDWNRIAELLDRYYAGELSLEEEEKLRSALQRDDLPEEWSPERDYILGTEEITKELRLSDRFEANFTASIKAEEKVYTRRTMYWLGGVAASLTLVLSLVFWPNTDVVGKQNPDLLQAGEWRAAEKAVSETKRSLALLEDQLSGSRAAFKYLEALSTPEEVNHLKKIDQVRKDLAK